MLMFPVYTVYTARHQQGSNGYGGPSLQFNILIERRCENYEFLFD